MTWNDQINYKLSNHWHLFAFLLLQLTLDPISPFLYSMSFNLGSQQPFIVVWCLEDWAITTVLVDGMVLYRLPSQILVLYCKDINSMTTSLSLLTTYKQVIPVPVIGVWWLLMILKYLALLLIDIMISRNLVESLWLFMVSQPRHFSTAWTNKQVDVTHI